MPNPFLTIVTRHMTSRPRMLVVNQMSLVSQTDQDLEQVLIIDSVGLGVEASYDRLSDYTQQVRGAYVFMLDDDDLLIDRNFVAELKRATFLKPELVMVRMRHQPELVLPDDYHWGKPPELGCIGVSGFVVRRDVWVDNVAEFQPVYHGDYTFISAVYPKCTDIVWLDRIASATQHGHNHGLSENSLDPIAVCV